MATAGFARWQQIRTFTPGRPMHKDTVGYLGRWTITAATKTSGWNRADRERGAESSLRRLLLHAGQTRAAPAVLYPSVSIASATSPTAASGIASGGLVEDEQPCPGDLARDRLAV